MTHKESSADLSPEVTATELEKEPGAAATGVDPGGVTPRNGISSSMRAPRW